ncbi:MAG: HDOD domain-containing protein [Bryobacteraceae bacterium]
MSTPAEAGIDYRRKILGSIDQLPPFSPVLARVMASLADENISFAHLSTLIENDTVLAGTILRVVNSPLYGRRATINSVRHALSIVGLIKIRNLVLGLSVTKRWATARVPRLWSARLFNLHSLACGIMADLLVLHVPVGYAEGAFAAGLLHDIGKLLMAVAIPAEFEELADMARRRGCATKDIEQEILGVSHPDLSAQVLEKWNLPVPIREAVFCHHTPDSAAGGELHLAHIIEAADYFVTRLGYTLDIPAASGVSTPDTAPEEDRHGVYAAAQGLAETFREEFETLRAIL